MKSIAVVIPWFGTLPETFIMWKISVLSNSSIDFYLYTDAECESKSNLHVIPISFGEFVRKLQRNFDFPILCDRPYKLCDFKPCYGEVLSDLFSGYDFWGCCDMDMVFGDIRSFLTDDVLDSYDKIFIEGHLSLFRNTTKMNSLYRDSGSYPEYNFEEVFQSQQSCYFDEYRGMELKIIRNNVRCFKNDSIRCNFDPQRNQFYKFGEQVIARWRERRLFTVSRTGQENEMLYVHIAKRRMKSFISGDTKDFLIVPGSILECTKDLESGFNASFGGGGYKYSWLLSRLKSRLKNDSLSTIVNERKRMKECAEYKNELLKAMDDSPAHTSD